MAFEIEAVLEDWKTTAIIPLYEGEVEKDECSNYKGISLLSGIGKIPTGVGDGSRPSSQSD